MQFSFTQIKTRIMLIRRDCIQYLNSEPQARAKQVNSKKQKNVHLGINQSILTTKIAFLTPVDKVTN
jgi:hypothetical protein